MPELTITLTLAAFFAGVLMFLAPCTLPLLPAFLAFISGTSEKNLRLKHTPAGLKRLVMRNAMAFVFGFTLVFVSFGILAGFFGSIIGPFRSVITPIGGVFVIIFGLFMIGFLHIPLLTKEYKITMPLHIHPGRPVSSFLMGGVFALGWTPCVGPVLATVLLLATTASTMISGIFLLLVFSLGLAVPFLFCALFYAHIAHIIEKYLTVSKWINYIGGVFLILIGVLLLTDNFGLTVEYGYLLLNAIGIEGFLDYY